MNAPGFRRAMERLQALPLVVMVALGVTALPAAAQEKPEITWYGYVKMDASWDQNIIEAGNFARWVVSPDQYEPHSHFNMTARQTRLGMRATTKLGKASVVGRWESDFYGGGAENKNSLQVRHAYVEVSWPSGWSIIAGQTSDVISPLVPSTLNYTVAWWAGDTGYRRPQFRVTKKADLGEGKALTLQGAATRTIGDDFVSAEPGDAGSDAGYPTFQGLAGLTLPVGGRPMTLGAYVHRGKENLHHQLGGELVYLWSSGWGGYLTLPLGSAVTLSGEAWAGSNMDDYLGGIGQGMRVTQETALSIHSQGGWAELAVKGGNGVSVRFGASMDDPDDADLTAGYRSRNLAGWGTLVKDFGAGLSSGIEISHWDTRYIGMADGKSWRVQGSMIFSF